MKKLNKILLVIMTISLLLLAGCRNKSDSVKIGWLTAVSTQGQVAEVLKNTDILEQNGLTGEFLSFSYAPPLNEVANSEGIDVLFEADLPALSLISKNDNYFIAGRLSDFTIAIIVPYDSDIKDVKDLKGKKIGIPFGATAHYVALKMIEDGGLDPNKDVEQINLDIAEQNALVSSGWGEMDALVSVYPLVSIFETNKQAKVLETRPGMMLIVMSKSLERKKAKAFVKSVMESYEYYSKNTERANQWYIDDVRIKYNPKFLDAAANFENNTKVKSAKEVDLTLDQSRINDIKIGANFAKSYGLLKNVPDVNSIIDQSLVKEVQRELSR
ncbi:MAG TPA: ABC transporter substrate-binding protein [Candidatus Nanoarchaeia archaeon]|nr:ABC transporter substrate-binding protein [Candidatus Nanoarchaeia archaeon]